MDNNFNGFSKIEIEMMKEEMSKALPALLAVAPIYAKLIKVNFDELRNQGFNDQQSMYMAVLATSKQFGLN